MTCGSHRYRYVIGDATEDGNLVLAGLPKARAVFALLPSDADNLYLTLSAKGLNPSAAVVARASVKAAESKLERAGADHVVSPYELVGMRLLQKVLSPTLMEFMDLTIHREHLQLIMEEFRVSSGSTLAGYTIEEARIRSRYGLIVVAINGPTAPCSSIPMRTRRWNPETCSCSWVPKIKSETWDKRREPDSQARRTGGGGIWHLAGQSCKVGPSSRERLKGRTGRFGGGGSFLAGHFFIRKRV